MKYFSIEELMHSDVATKRSIDNTPSPSQESNLRVLIENVLDPIRQQWGAPITINSGFRSKALNLAVGGVANSHHMQGLAADITAGSKSKNRELYAIILEMGLPFDQLIDESNYSWIHISYVEGMNRNQSFKL